MKKILIILFVALSMFMLTTSVSAKNTNMELQIYERFIDKRNLEYIPTTSIWSYNQEYKDALYTSLNLEEPLYTIEIN